MNSTTRFGSYKKKRTNLHHIYSEYQRARLSVSITTHMDYEWKHLSTIQQWCHSANPHSPHTVPLQQQLQILVTIQRNEVWEGSQHKAHVPYKEVH
jgi:hypothetical protein